MKRPKLELSGQQFGHITIISRSAKSRYWTGTCDCNPGVQRQFNGSRLAKGEITHCGCKRASHGHTAGKTRSLTYLSWQDMKARCKAMGITEADGTHTIVRGYQISWREFDNFLTDMGPRPLGHTLDRIDTLGHYTKDNCRWATRKQQDFNKTNTKMYCAEPGVRNMYGSAWDWAEFFSKELGVPMSVEEFRLCIKFFTVAQLRCCIHPLALDVAGLRKRVQEEKNKEFTAMWIEAELNHECEDTGQVIEDYEDTGQVDDDAPIADTREIEEKAVEAKTPEWDGGEVLPREFFKRNPPVLPDF
jgi:hypothetical protein